MIWEKIKSIALVICGIIILVFSIGFFDPLKLRKKSKQQDDFDKDLQLKRSQTNETVYKDLSDLSTSTDRDNALRTLLDRDYPKR